MRVRRVPAWRSATAGVEGADCYTAYGFANPTRRVLAGVLHTRAEVRVLDLEYGEGAGGPGDPGMGGLAADGPAMDAPAADGHIFTLRIQTDPGVLSLPQCRQTHPCPERILATVPT